MPTYYAYGEHKPSALNGPDTGYWEDPRDWPRTYKYIPAYDGSQGFHPPAPVYQSHSTNPAMYYYAHNSGNPTPTPYYANGYYYAAPQTSSGYYCHPAHDSYDPSPSYYYEKQPSFTCTCYKQSCTCYKLSHTCTCYQSSSSNPYYYSAAAAAAAAAEAATANHPTYYYGATRAEIDAQNAAIAYNTGATKPSQLAPYKTAAGQQFWCKELDGSWTLRTHNDIVMGELSPGHWEMAKTGYHYWVRSSPS